MIGYYSKKLGLTDALNMATANIIRWCTPSVELSAARMINPYYSDISVSFHALGSPSEPSGFFKLAYDKASKVYGADHTLFSVNGSTGSNFIILRAFSKQFKNLSVLAQRNIHKSIITACEDYSINLNFLPMKVESNLQIFLPNTLEEVVGYVKKLKPNVLLITNPTYEGLTLDVKSLVKQIRKIDNKVIIYIEEAWGGHLHFSKKLPDSAMESGADICVQSTHKQGGALQQTSMIHWKEGRVDNELLLDSFRHLSSTSPSFILLASLDAAREVMEKHGLKKINGLLNIAEELSSGINNISGLKVVSTEEIKQDNPSVFCRDETKVIVDVTESGMTGYECAEILERDYSIIVEKCDQFTLLFLVPFQSTLHDAITTIEALKVILTFRKHHNIKKDHVFTNLPKSTVKKMGLQKISKLDFHMIERVTLEHSLGRVAAENIIPYPPGIPTTIKGEEMTEEMVIFYRTLRSSLHCKVMANDEKLRTISVVK